MIKLATLTFNPFGENTYILYDETGECLIIDAGCYSEKEQQTLEAFLEKNNLKPIMAANTHGHVDHICGVDYVVDRWNIPFAIHGFEKPLLDTAPVYGLTMGFNIDSAPVIDIDLAGTKEVKLGNSTVQVIQTPGHSPGHVVFYVPEADLLISGDLLFKESIGRTDLPGGSYPQLMNSIIEKVIPLGSQTQVFPGHGPHTSVAHEVMFNPFIVEAVKGEVNYQDHEN